MIYIRGCNACDSSRRTTSLPHTPQTNSVIHGTQSQHFLYSELHVHEYGSIKLHPASPKLSSVFIHNTYLLRPVFVCFLISMYPAKWQNWSLVQSSPLDGSLLFAVVSLTMLRSISAETEHSSGTYLIPLRYLVTTQLNYHVPCDMSESHIDITCFQLCFSWTLPILITLKLWKYCRKSKIYSLEAENSLHYHFT